MNDFNNSSSCSKNYEFFTNASYCQTYSSYQNSSYIHHVMHIFEISMVENPQKLKIRPVNQSKIGNKTAFGELGVNWNVQECSMITRGHIYTFRRRNVQQNITNKSTFHALKCIRFKWCHPGFILALNSAPDIIHILLDFLKSYN